MLVGFTTISLLITPFLRKAAKKRIELEAKTNNIFKNQ